MTKSEQTEYVNKLLDVEDKLNNLHGKKREDLTETDIKLLNKLIDAEHFKFADRDA